MLIFYIVIIMIHWNRDKTEKKKSIEYNFILTKILHKEIDPNSLGISNKDKKYLRDLLILKLNFSSDEEKDLLRNLYKIWELEKKDIKQLKSRRWWKKVEALKRLKKMKIIEAETLALKLMDSKKAEVRYAALEMLVEIKSEKIYPFLYTMFSSSSRWAYRYLVNVLSVANIPPAYLKPLTISNNRDFRKAAAILLGSKGDEYAIPLLEKLANDTIKDVRREAIKSLGEINTDKSLRVMEKHSEDQNSQIRAILAKALSGYNNDTSFKLLEKLVDDIDFEVRLEAFYSLNKLGPSGKNIMEKYYHKYPDLAMEFLKKENQEVKGV